MRSAMLRYAAIALLACATSLRAAPPSSVSATYEVRMNGLSVASISESYQAQDGSYRLTSNSTPQGIFALVKRLAVSFVSTGEVTPQGLRPHRFEGRRATGRIPEAVADFDWSSGRLQLEHEGKAQTLPLAAGAGAGAATMRALSSGGGSDAGVSSTATPVITMAWSAADNSTAALSVHSDLRGITAPSRAG